MEEVHQWITSLVANKIYSDVELHVEVVQEQHTFVIPAHSFVLRNASKVLDTMLKPGKFKEGATGVAEIKVYGKKMEAVSFIRYLYTKKLQALDVNAYVALIQTAHLYEITTLFKICDSRIRSGLTPYSVCGVYSALNNISSKALRKFCEAMMLKFAFLIFGEKLHITLSEGTLIFLLRSENLNVLDEEQALQATWDWGHSQCILTNAAVTKEPKDMIASLLPFIKWSEISGLESTSPWRDLYTHYKKIATSSSITIERKFGTAISLPCFASVLNIYQSVDSETSSLDYVQFNGKQALITLTCDHTVLLAGFEIHVGFSSKISGLHPFDIYVNTLLLQDTSFQIFSPKKRLGIGSVYYYDYIVTLDFGKPVLLKTNNFHTIYFQLTKFNYETQKLNLYSKAREPGILGPDDVVSFRVTGQIAAIQKLFYFLQE